jgi:hypothetical protein
MTSLYRASGPRKKTRKRVPAHPARKPKSQQWATTVAGGAYICGSCKMLYDRPSHLHAHKKSTCYNWLFYEDLRFLTTKRALSNRSKPPKTRMRPALGIQKRKVGRPKHRYHICKHCRENFDTSEKKRDHQRRCKTGNQSISTPADNINKK